MKSAKRYELNNCYPLEACGFNLFKIKAYLKGNISNIGGVVELLLDTGASFTIIQPQIIQNLGYDLKKSLKTEILTGVGGNIIYAQITKMNCFSCIGTEIQDFKIRAYDPKLPPQLRVNGILGMDFLKAAGAIISINDSIIACS
jgi:predicted aspartyl protease